MPKRMTTINIGETSGVDRPAHRRDGWLVMKSAGLQQLIDQPDDPEATMPPVQKTTTPEPPSLEGLTDDQKAYVEALQAAAAEPPPAAEPSDDGDDLQKALDSMPDEIRKAVESQMGDLQKSIEAAQASAEKAASDAVRERETRERNEHIAKAREELKFIPVPSSVGTSVDDLGALLHGMRKAEAALPTDMLKSEDADGNDVTISYADQVEEILKAINGQIESSKLFKELGSDLPGGGSGSAEGKLESIAKGYRESDDELSEAQAFAKAIRENPEIYAEYRREQATRV